MISLSERKDLIRAALGKVALDLRIDNIQVVNVYTGSIEPGSIGIKDGRIVSPYAADYQALEVLDGAGAFALPGFIDTHVHLDSTLVIPEYLSQLL
ncbi:MAG: hypothetical protein MUP11_02790, partial [Anaerolineales bacterium]|nr:hypothetical protein [Anaerolineales bacterium]